MLYSDAEFVVFLLSTLAIYVCLPGHRARSWCLLAASLFFFACFGILDLLVFLAVLLVSWGAAALVAKHPDRRWRFAWAGICLILGNLLYWKYSSWAYENLQALFPHVFRGETPRIPLPIGISFFTLQAIGYLADLANGEVPVMPFGRYALFKSFFGQLVSGPIVRAKELAPQLESLRRPAVEDLAMGAGLFCLGFVKKVLVADPTSVFVDRVFRDPFAHDRTALVLGVLGFTVQMWADFSGYTDMGRGAARMFGIRLPENFLSPFLARTPSEYWSRWHITLSSWIKDYVFTPMAFLFARGNPFKLFVTVVTVMFTVGLWHGASWTYVIHGLYHGGLLVIERKLKWSRLNKWFRHEFPKPARDAFLALTVFGAVVFSNIIFRARTVKTLWAYLVNLVRGYGRGPATDEVALVLGGILFCGVCHAVFYYRFEDRRFPVLDRLQRWAEEGRSRKADRIPAWYGAASGVALGLLLLAVLFVRPRAGHQPFIYFAF